MEEISTATQGAKEREPADPAAAGAKAQEPAAPVVQEPPAPQAPESGRENAVREDYSNQTREQAAAHAEARREGQREKLRREALDWQARRETELEVTRRAELARVERREAELDEQTRRVRDRAAQLAGQEQIRLISRWDPKIRSVRELMNEPNFGEIRARVFEHGDTISEAYEFVNRERIAGARAARARQAALSGAESTAHLTASASGTGGPAEIAVPAAVAANYRAAFPAMTDAEMRKRYRTFLNYRRE